LPGGGHPNPHEVKTLVPARYPTAVGTLFLISLIPGHLLMMRGVDQSVAQNATPMTSAQHNINTNDATVPLG